jgi:hypothetical protein
MPAGEQDVPGEIEGSWPHASDEGVPDWHTLLNDAAAQVELLGYSLIDILATPGVIDTLAAKAADCQVRILISAPDSIWVRAAARRLGQEGDDFIGRSALAREIETARGHLERLTRHDRVELGQFYADPGHRILRFDERMLISPYLYGVPICQAPLLLLRRRAAGGLFDQFADHLEAIANEATEPVESAPELYPDPHDHPDRYEAMTATGHQQQLEDVTRRYHQHTSSVRPIEHVRAELRRSPKVEPTQVR